MKKNISTKRKRHRKVKKRGEGTKRKREEKYKKKKEIEILKELFLIVSNGFAEKSLCRTAKGFKRLENTQEN